MSDFDNCRTELLKLRESVPQLIEQLQIGERVAADAWKNLDAQLLPLLDASLPLMVAVCGGANSGKSTFFNSFLGVTLSPVRGDAGSTRRVLAAAGPSVFDDRHMARNLFAPFGRLPEPLSDPRQLEKPGPPLDFVNNNETFELLEGKLRILQTGKIGWVLEIEGGYPRFRPGCGKHPSKRRLPALPGTENRHDWVRPETVRDLIDEAMAANHMTILP